MKTSKNYENLPTYYYRPEMKACLMCGSLLKRSHTAWQKTVTTLTGSGRVYNQAYRCSRGPDCDGQGQVYRSAYADGLSLPYYSYGLDVIVAIGQGRLRRQRTIPELHGQLRQGGMAISEREVEYLFDAYLLLLACSHGARLERYRPEIESNGGIVLAIDGAKPEKGQPGLFIFRDALTGCRLHSTLLYSADGESLAEALRQVVALGLPIQAVISDDEAATVKAVAMVLPDVAHGLCHLHFLKAAQEPIFLADNQLARDLKSPLRPVTEMERRLQQDTKLHTALSVNQRTALQGYLDTIRAVTFTRGQSPFHLTGVPMYEALSQITASLHRSASLRAHPFLSRLQTMTTTDPQHEATYQQVKRQQGWFLGLAELLDVPDTRPYQAAAQTGDEVAQDVADYLAELDWLAYELPQDAALFRHFRTRAQAWAPGLYWTYEIPPLPRTNNALEVDIGNLKEQYRRITGRRSLKDYLMRYGPYLVFDDDQDDPDELLRWFQVVERQDFLDEKAKLDALRQHLRNMHRFRQNPQAFLDELEQLWFEDG
jgi:hypothetical protein